MLDEGVVIPGDRSYGTYYKIIDKIIGELSIINVMVLLCEIQ